MSPINVQRFIRRTDALRLRPMEQRPAPVTLDHRVSEHMPALAPRPSTPSTPADIVRGTPRWPGVLILRPVTVFGPSSPTSQMVGTPSSEVSELIQTPEEVHRELVEPVAQSENGVKISTTNLPPSSLSDMLSKLSSN